MLVFLNGIEISFAFHYNKLVDFVLIVLVGIGPSYLMFATGLSDY
jgi:hypothetical protein